MASSVESRSMGPNTVEQMLPQVNGRPLFGATEKAESGLHNLGICASPAEPLQAPRKRSKKHRTVIARACRWLVDHQIGISLSFFAAIASIHLYVPSLQQMTGKFFALSYYNPETQRYAFGVDDRCIVLLSFMAFTGIRVAFMEYIAAPFAKFANIKGRKNHVRFAEQAWVFVFYSISWTFGMYCMSTAEHWFNLDGQWADYPSREMTGLFKWYYLVQIGFWFQQIAVVNIEERRKDHWQMLSHHFVTCILLLTSYAYSHYRVGNTILCLMDFVDILLPLAKMLRYVGLQFACDCTFGLFIIGWFITRHVLYSVVLYSIYEGIPRVIGWNCWHGAGNAVTGPTEVPNSLSYLLEPFIDQSGTVCSSAATNTFFLGFLGALQVILLMWFGLILRLAWRVITGSNADDPRSDDEEEEDEESDEIEEKSPKVGAYTESGMSPEQPLEEDVGVEQMHFRSRPRTGPNRLSSRSSGVALPVKKELLNRVGCDTKTTK